MADVITVEKLRNYTYRCAVLEVVVKGLIDAATDTHRDIYLDMGREVMTKAKKADALNEAAAGKPEES